MGAGKAAVACALVASLAAAPIEALAVNPPKPAVPMYYHRGLAIGNVAFVDDEFPSVTAGLLYQFSAWRSMVTRGPECGGLGCVTAPQLYLHSLLTAGAVSSSSEEYTVFGQLGVVYRTTESLVSSVGLVAQGVQPERALGPVLRVELLDNVGLQAGWLLFDRRDQGGFFVSIDYLSTLFDDLELTRSERR